jgi:hypothetical protein
VEAALSPSISIFVFGALTSSMAGSSRSIANGAPRMLVGGPELRRQMPRVTLP